jgi:hypothetical protein
MCSRKLMSGEAPLRAVCLSRGSIHSGTGLVLFLQRPAPSHVAESDKSLAALTYDDTNGLADTG